MNIPRPHLTVLFNALYDAGETTVPVTHPSDEIGELFQIHLEEDGQCTVEFTTDSSGYADRRSTINERYGEPAITEVPDRRSYLNAFVASGIVPIVNLEDVGSFLDTHGSPDLTAGHRPVVAGFDTNLMPWRMADVLGLRPGHSGIINGFALATGVRDELVWDRKRQDTRSLEEAFGPEFDEVWNQPRGPDREGRLGENYYRELRDRRYSEEIRTDTGDDALIDGYDEFQSEGRKEVLLFSNDRDFVERARAHRILAQWVSLPSAFPTEKTVSWNAAETALYHLTVLFGVLEVPKTTLYGVWRGKDGTAWHDHLLQVDCRSPKLDSAIERDLAIIETYEAN